MRDGCGNARGKGGQVRPALGRHPAGALSESSPSPQRVDGQLRGDARCSALRLARHCGRAGWRLLRRSSPLPLFPRLFSLLPAAPGYMIRAHNHTHARMHARNHTHAHAHARRDATRRRRTRTHTSTRLPTRTRKRTRTHARTDLCDRHDERRVFAPERCCARVRCL